MTAGNGSKPDVRADLGELGRTGRLNRFFTEWQEAQQRSQLAQQTAQGAVADALVKEARFKGAAELIYGMDVTYEYDPVKGLSFKPSTPAKRRELAKKKR